MDPDWVDVFPIKNCDFPIKNGDVAVLAPVYIIGFLRVPGGDFAKVPQSSRPESLQFPSYHIPLKTPLKNPTTVGRFSSCYLFYCWSTYPFPPGHVPPPEIAGLVKGLWKPLVSLNKAGY